ncbi:MAG TPA: hypothetical protein PKN57_12305 [Saprospiraceae bacterium]|nr:hypothetical protein [Saprospiraceae bacterium]HMZ74438.1 hypothetical protein [Saprospiraceae bacterium]HNE66574.1 hypothetical protein [Saprospiraceae bacterium]HNJ17952.1 hypothetical protein [Saprospiraceae bacterium]HNJ64075.1 hypothetical protein [Saprospiraceae bacterium]
MKTNLVVWGTNANDEKVLILMELMADDNKVVIKTIPENLVSDELEKKLMDEWRTGSAVELPEGITTIENELSVTDNILPEDLKTDRTDVIHRAQTQWHFIVLSSKLNKLYQNELEDFYENINKLKEYSQETWEDLKNFWQKVQEQVRDKNLLAEHAGNLRESTNVLFSKLKELKSSLEDETRKASAEILEKFKETMSDIEQKINEGNRLQSIFNDLKEIQNAFRDMKFTKEDRSEAWERLDNAFKSLKDKKYGNNTTNSAEGSPLVRIQRRYDGLKEAVKKMESSIDRDKSELSFHTGKASNTERQLEALVSQAKLAMIQERISSKEEKLAEMLKTKEELEARMSELKLKEDARADQEKYEAAKKAAQDKIANEIKQASETRADTNEDSIETEENPVENAIETAIAVSSVEEKDSE